MSVRPAMRLLPSLLLLLAGLLVPAPAQAAADPVPTAGQDLFTPLDPVRLLDTREGLGAAQAAVGPGGTVDLQVRGVASVPDSATAVVLNVTATRATRSTDVRVYPTDAAQVPTVSNLNLPAGGTRANLVTVKVGADGAVRLRNAAGSVELLADLSGYTGGSSGSTFVPSAPVRLLDTRDSTRVGAGQARTLDLLTDRQGRGSGVPAEATAVVLTVTAVAPTATTDVRVYPTRSGAPVPVVSNLNAAPGATVPNLVVVAVGAGVSVQLRNQAGQVHLLADLAGWYVPGTSGAAFHPVEPFRLLDTRVAGGTRLPAGGTLDLRVAGNGFGFDVAGGRGIVPAQASALVLNVTAVGASAGTDIRVYPAGPGPVPNASNLNPARGQTVPNAVVVKVGRDGAVTLRNDSGTVDLVVDLAGWFVPAGDGWDLSWPQCTARGATTSRLPDGGAFAVIGLTRGVPFTDNECFAAQWSWASSLPGEPSVYLNTNAPGPRDTPDGQVWQQVCGTGTPTSDCARAYGVRVAQYALSRLPTLPHGGRPMLWLDVENGPGWQTGYAAAVAVNRAVYAGVAESLRDSGYRVGLYTDRASAGANNDWFQIMGEYRLRKTQNWLFRSQSADGSSLCRDQESPTGGPVVMVQIQPAQSGRDVDVDHLC